MVETPSIAPTPGRTAEVPQTQAAQSATERQTPSDDQNGNQEARPNSAATSKAPPFKEPPISLSPQLAGIKVGDTLSGTVKQIDAQVRAVVQNDSQTVLVDPAAHLKAGKAVDIKVTQVAPRFLGTVPSPAPNAPKIPVQLALVALRGVSVPAAPADTAVQLTTALPNTQAMLQATPLNTAEDIATTLALSAKASQTNKVADASPTAVSAGKVPWQSATPAARAQNPQSQAAPTLLQASVSIGAPEGKTAPDIISFIARHSGLSAQPKPIALTVLPAAPSTFAYAIKPNTASPIGQLFSSGRAVFAQVVEPSNRATASGSAPTPTNAAREAATLIARAGPLSFRIPAIPGASLRAGDSIVLVSASADPSSDAPDTKAAAQPRNSGAKPTAVANPVSTIIAPMIGAALKPLAGLPTATIAPVAARLSQLIAHSFFNPDHTPKHAPENTQLEHGQKGSNAHPLKRLPQETLTALKTLLDAVEHLRQEVAPHVPINAGATTLADAPALPLVIAGPDAPLVASLFHLAGHGRADQSVSDDDGTPAPEQDERTFEVAIEFERFGKTHLSGRVAPRALYLTLKSEHALPRDLRQELKAALDARLDAAGLSGALTFKTLAARA